MLEKLIESLKKNKETGINYVVPDLWFLEDLKIENKRLPNNEIMVNPYDFYISIIEDYILKNRIENVNYNKSLSKALKIKSTDGDWIKKSVLYSMMIRTSSSYDSDRSYSLDISNINGLKETGTFIKSLALLPLLKRLGVDVLYLLPISKYSLKDKKGELGSPYGVESFTKLDPMLKEVMTKDDLTIEEEFSCLVEACHILNIRVTIDIIPRTNSICSELIINHPDWFYWIKASEKDKYQVPKVDNVGINVQPTYNLLENIYNSKDVKRHIKMFKDNPKEVDENKFNKIKEKDPIKFLDIIEKEFDLTVAPAFSDNINDPQPAWSDVTLFRMYFDDPIMSKKYIRIKHSPYILFDNIKANLYPGKVPNMELFELISNIIPYYQKKFGIDGARIDMGHALPKELLKMIMENAKKNDSDFAFIAEELEMSKDKAAKENGYNIMIGNSFWALPRINEGAFKYFIDNSITKEIPAFAAVETHDTRRVAFRYNGKKLSRFMTVLDYFIPNTVPFINSGQEFYEREPMNIGLDSDSSDLLALDTNDIYYKKLALFDKYSLHYLNDDSHEIINHLKDPIEIRKKWIDSITDKNQFINLHYFTDSYKLIGLGYLNKENNKALIIIGNADMDNGLDITLSLEELREKIGNNDNVAKLLYATYEMPRDFYDFTYNGDLKCYLGSGEIKIIEL